MNVRSLDRSVVMNVNNVSNCLFVKNYKMHFHITELYFKVFSVDFL